MSVALRFSQRQELDHRILERGGLGGVSQM